MALVSVTLVAFNSASYLRRCLDSLFAQTGVDQEVIVVDNASEDATLNILDGYRGRLRVIRNPTNRGFAAAQNQAIQEAKGDWILCLNPDVELAPDFTCALLEAVRAKPDVGSACGKLWRMAPNGERFTPPVLDSTGIYFTPALRHLDRGSNHVDADQYQRREYVFGATAAAALYRRAMIEEISPAGEFFDEDFFAYREDADVAWRAQLAGWRCLYVPEAVGYHVRRVLPQVRRDVPAELNYHSVKNRFLMRAKNMGWGLYWRLFLPMKVRDLGILLYVLGRERGSLPAFSYLWRNRRRLWAKRCLVQRLRKVSDRELRVWFSFRPVSFSADVEPMKIVVLGTRGVPASYGGFETLAEELGARLAVRGHEVSVYSRRPHSRYARPTYRGMRIVLLPTLPFKYLDTVVHTLLSTLHAVWSEADIVLVCNVANSPFMWIPRLAGKPTALNVDGLDRRRRKWNWLGRAYLWMCEWLALVTPTAMVTDAKVMQEYYYRRYGKASSLITYGADLKTPAGSPEDILKTFGLHPRMYILYVSRLEPENNPELVIRGFQLANPGLKLAIVGGNPYRPDYVERLKRMGDSQVVFTGPVYGDSYWQLQRHAALYVHATEVGGTHPALIEAMACGQCVLYLNTPENREVAADAGIQFEASPDDLARNLRRVLEDDAMRTRYGRQAYQRVRECYNWDKITDRYETLFHLLRTGVARRLDTRQVPS